MASSAKGTKENPYSMSECDEMLDNGTWPGGYVKDDSGQVSYVTKSVTVWGYSGSGSGSEEHGSDFEFSTGSLEWHEPDDEENGSEEEGNRPPSGNEGDNQTDGNYGGGAGGGGGKEQNLPSEPNLMTPVYIDEPGVRVVTKRYILTNKCTISVFEAQAYGENGHKLNEFVVNGYFLERPYEANLAEESGSLKAIQPGVYKIIPHIPGQRFKWYLEGVPGRAGIAIHSGNKPEDSRGCLLTGTSVLKVNDSSYEVRGSISKLNSLFALFEMYGYDNISITITQ